MAQDHKLDIKFEENEEQVIEWRRYLHQHPELFNQEYETAKYIAEQLRTMDIEVHEGVARTGVVGYLKGGSEGPTVALRTDMDALPVVERGGAPFASTVKSLTYLTLDYMKMESMVTESK